MKSLVIAPAVLLPLSSSGIAATQDMADRRLHLKEHLKIDARASLKSGVFFWTRPLDFRCDRFHFTIKSWNRTLKLKTAAKPIDRMQNYLTLTFT
jgi:hypothetical protein